MDGERPPRVRVGPWRPRAGATAMATTMDRRGPRRRLRTRRGRGSARPSPPGPGRRRADHRPPPRGVDGVGAAHRGGPGVLLDRPGRDGPRSAAVRAGLGRPGTATRSTRWRSAASRASTCNARLCERPNGDWGYSIARQYLYDTADAVRLEALAGSSWPELADRVRLMQLEEALPPRPRPGLVPTVWPDGPVTGAPALGRGTCRQRSARRWRCSSRCPAKRTSSPTASSRGRARTSWRRGSGRSAPSSKQRRSTSCSSATRRAPARWCPPSSGEIEEEAPFAVPGIVRRDGRWVHEGGFAGAGGRHGRHSEDFAPLWEEMTALYRDHPGATW